MGLFTSIFDCAFLDIDHKTCSIPSIGVLLIVYLKYHFQGSPKFTVGLKTAYFIYHGCLRIGGVGLFTSIFDCALLDIDHKTCSIPFTCFSFIVNLKCICQGSPKDLNDQKGHFSHTMWCLNVCVMV